MQVSILARAAAEVGRHRHEARCFFPLDDSMDLVDLVIPSMYQCECEWQRDCGRSCAAACGWSKAGRTRPCVEWCPMVRKGVSNEALRTG